MTRRRIFEVWLLVGLVSSSVAACSSQGSGTNPGDSVVVAGTTLVVWRSDGGGFGPGIPAGAACDFADSYSLNLQSGELTWNLCNFIGTDPRDPSAYIATAGSRVLTADERGQASAAATAIKVSSVTTCGADLDSRSLEIDGTSGSITYGDDFYACEKLFEHYVNTGQLENLREVLDGMARNP